MAQPRYASTRNSMPISAANAEKRMRERILRHQQLEMANQQDGDVPSFAEPKRITAQRQDSLTNRIQNTLGDSNTINSIILRDPNSWYGTSRNAVNQAIARSQEGNRNQPEGATGINRANKSDVDGTRSRIPNPSANNLHYRPSQNTPTRPRNEYHQQATKEPLNSVSGQPNADPSVQYSQLNQYGQNAQDRKHLISPCKDNQNSNRDRLQSTDAPGEMDIIFEDMHMVQQVLTDTGLLTPQVGQVGREFNFNKVEPKTSDINNNELQGVNGNLAVQSFEVLEGTEDDEDDAASNNDSGSSGDDVSESDDDSDDDEEEEEEEEEKDSWSLGQFVEKLKPECEPLITINNQNSLTKKSKNAQEKVPEKSPLLHENINNFGVQSPQQSKKQTSDYGRNSERNSEQTTELSRSHNHKFSAPVKANDGTRAIPERSRSKGRVNVSSQSPLNSESPRLLSSTGNLTAPSPQNDKRGRSGPRDSSNESATKINSYSRNSKKTPKPPSSERKGSRNSSKDSRPFKSYQSTVKSKESSESSMRHESHEYAADCISRHSPSTPSSVSNTTLPSAVPTDQRHRIGDKAPFSMLAAKKQQRKPPPRSSYFPSSSESSDSEDDSSSSSSSSDNDELNPSKYPLPDHPRQSPSPAQWNPYEKKIRSDSTSSFKKVENRSKTSKTSKVTAKDIPVSVTPARKQTGIKSKCKPVKETSNNQSVGVTPSKISKPSIIKQHKSVKKKDCGSETEFVLTSHKPIVKTSKKSSEKGLKSKHSDTRINHSVSNPTLSQAKEASRRKRKVEPNSTPVTDLIIPKSEPHSYPSLWVKVNLGFSKPTVLSQPNSHTSKSNQTISPKSNHNSTTELPHDSTENQQPAYRFAARSTGSQTEQPIRRAENVQVAVAASSSDWSPGFNNMQNRKGPQIDISTNRMSDSSSSDHRSKQRKQDSESPANNENYVEDRKRSKRRREDNMQRKKRRKDKQMATPHNDNRSSREPAQHLNQQPSSQSLSTNQQLSALKKASCSASIISEPDSSWPEQESLLKADEYMRQGKSLKHEGDTYTDSKTGRTRLGESLNRALVYFEATLCFVMNGYMLEIENRTERGDGTPGSAHSPARMYHQSIDLLDYIRKMKPHSEKDELAFKRLNVSCLRSQSLLYLRIYKLKKEVANQCSELMSDHFKGNVTRSNRTPSPWHPISGQNVLSPASPAVPSPYGFIVPGPSPVAIYNNCEAVSSSTQVNKMASPPNHSNYMQARMYEVVKNYHTLVQNLTQAHEKWDQAGTLAAEHSDFFQNVETLCGRKLCLETSLRDMVSYNKVTLHRLRETQNKSPRE